MAKVIRRFLAPLVPVLVLGCSSLGGIVGAADAVLGVLCETRESLRAAQSCEGDVYCRIAILKAYLVENGHDDEVAALLQLLEAQVKKAL